MSHVSIFDHNHFPTSMYCLVDDVLLRIFQLLSIKDLLNCESVCHRWREICKYVFEKLVVRNFQKKKPLWIRAAKHLGFQNSEWNLQESHCSVFPRHILFRGICRAVHQAHVNWQKGKFNVFVLKLLSHEISFALKADNDLVSWMWFFSNGCGMWMNVDLESVKLGVSEIEDSLGKRFFSGTYLLQNNHQGWEVTDRLSKKVTIPHELVFNRNVVCYNDTFLFHSVFEGENHFHSWKIKHSNDLLSSGFQKHVSFDHYDDLELIQMDEKFVVGVDGSQVIFFSAATLKEISSFCFPGAQRISYSGGFLFLNGHRWNENYSTTCRRPAFITVIDIASGFRGSKTLAPLCNVGELMMNSLIRGRNSTYSSKVCSNSSVFVFLSCIIFQSPVHCTLHVFDADNVKNAVFRQTQTDSSLLVFPLYTIYFPNFVIDRIIINQSELATMGRSECNERHFIQKLIIMKFSNFDFLKLSTTGLVEEIHKEHNQAFVKNGIGHKIPKIMFEDNEAYDNGEIGKEISSKELFRGIRIPISEWKERVRGRPVDCDEYIHIRKHYSERCLNLSTFRT